MRSSRQPVKAPSPPAEPLLRVPESFTAEFPDGSLLATETFINIGLLTGGVRSAVEILLRRHGVTSFGAFNVLSVLDGAGGALRPSEVAGRMMVTRATMTGLVDSLERRGLLERSVDEQDGRQRVLSLTPVGRRLVRRLVPEMHRFERDLMGVLDDGELTALLGMVARLQGRLADVAPDARPGIPS